MASTREKDHNYRKKGIKGYLLNLKDEIANDNIATVGAGVAFYFFLAVFPVLAAAVSIFGLINDPADVQQQMSRISHMLPGQAQTVIADRLQSVSQSSSQTLGWGMAFSLLLSLWSANAGTKTLFQGVNIAYNLKNERSFIRQTGITLLFTIGGMLVGLLSLGLVVAWPALIGKLGLPSIIQDIISYGRWPFLAIIIGLSLAVLYHYAPYRHHPKMKWVTWGSAAGTVLWLVGSWAFSFYVENFGSYNEMYGSFAAVIILMLYFNLTSFIILLGAEMNAVWEHRSLAAAGAHAHRFSREPEQKTDRFGTWD